MNGRRPDLCKNPRMPRGLTAAIASILAAVLVSACSGSIDPRQAANPGTTGRDFRAATKNWRDAACALPKSWLVRIKRGHWRGRGPDINLAPHNGNPFGGFPVATTHSGPWPFLQRVPLVFYGPGFIAPRGEIALDREVTLADIAPTLAELLGTGAPDMATGRPIVEALVPKRDRSPNLRLIVTVVWDGGGRNVLERWGDSLPFLRSLIANGTSISNATVGTSPSVTPAVHATIGTGAFPERHGIVNILQREDGVMVAGLGGSGPSSLEIPTLADTYDAETENVAKVGLVAKDAMHFPMLGHGSYLSGGDADIAVLLSRDIEGPLLGTLGSWYTLPAYLDELNPRYAKAARKIDADDGKIDGAWMGHDLPDDPYVERGFNRTPALTLFQTEASKTILEREGFGEDDVPDLFFTNYKEPDYIGHTYNYYSEEVGRTLEYADEALHELVQFLERNVGEKRWALVLTADHGQSPLPEEAGTWPIRADNVESLITEFVGAGENGVVQHIKQNGVWLDRDVLEKKGVTLVDVSKFVLGLRIRDDAVGRDFPERYRDRFDEPLFDAAFPRAEIPRLIRCAGGS